MSNSNFVISQPSCPLACVPLVVVVKLAQHFTISIFNAAPAEVQVYDKDSVTLALNCDKQSDSTLTVTLTASNLGDSDVSGFTLQAAVPKVRLSCP